MLGSFSSLTVSFSCTISFSSDTGLSPICSCRIAHMTIFLLSITEIVPQLKLSHLPSDLPSIFLLFWGKHQSAIEMYKIDWYSTSLVVWQYPEERILVLLSQGLVFLDHCLLFFWLLLGGSFPQAAWKKESRKAVGPPGKSNLHYKWHKTVNESLPFLRLFISLYAWVTEMVGLIQSSTSQFCRSRSVS